MAAWVAASSQKFSHPKSFLVEDSLFIPPDYSSETCPSQLKYLGRLPEPLAIRRDEVSTPHFEKAIALYPPLADYVRPCAGPSLERLFLFRKFRSQLCLDSDYSSLFVTACHQEYKRYPSVPTPSHLRSFKSLLHPMTFLTCVQRVKPTASPGYPQSREYHSKSGVIDDCLPDLYRAYVTRLRVLCSDLDFSSLSPEQLLTVFASDPFTVNLKNETRKRTKDTRIVLHASLVTELIYRALYGSICSFDILHYGEYGFNAGLSFNLEGATRILANHRGGTFSSDQPSFDYTIQEIEDLCVAHYNIARYAPSVPPVIFKIAENLAKVSARKVCLVGTGEAFAQMVPGVGAPGEYITNKRNSCIRNVRCMCALMVAGLPLDLYHSTNGDDAMEDSMGVDLTPFYARLGLPIRDARICTDEYEHCSHLWYRDREPVAQRFDKTLATLLLHRKIRPEHLLGFFDTFANHPDFPFALQLLDRTSALKD